LFVIATTTAGTAVVVVVVLVVVDTAAVTGVYIGRYNCCSDLSNNQLVSLPELAFANLTDLNTLLVVIRFLWGGTKSDTILTTSA